VMLPFTTFVLYFKHNILVMLPFTTFVLYFKHNIPSNLNAEPNLKEPD
jgi:hypothetical protein